MFALQILAICLLVLSAACFFGPQLVIYGPRALPTVWKQPQARFVSGFIVTAATLVMTAPYFGAALLESGSQVTIATLNLMSMTFGIV